MAEYRTPDEIAALMGKTRKPVAQLPSAISRARVKGWAVNPTYSVPPPHPGRGCECKKINVRTLRKIKGFCPCPCHGCGGNIRVGEE